MALVNGRSKLVAKILAEKGRWRRSPVTAHQDSLAETGELRTLRGCTKSIVGPRTSPRTALETLQKPARWDRGSQLEGNSGKPLELGGLGY